MPRRLAEIPYTEVARLLATGRPCVAVLPVGATEAHGPHLPLNTDVVISEAFGWRCGELLEPGMTAFLLPALAYTPADYAGSFAGTISVRWETAGSLLEDIGRGLHSHGFACLAIANSHFDPANVNVLRDAAKRIEGLGLPVAFADATRRTIASQLTAEFQSGDCHAGQFETSIVLAARPELVDLGAARSLPSNAANLIGVVAPGKAGVRFENAGMPRAYCGSPAGATAEEGRASIEVLAGVLADAVRKRLGL